LKKTTKMAMHHRRVRPPSEGFREAGGHCARSYVQLAVAHRRTRRRTERGAEGDAEIRLVDFSEFSITESNFPTLPKDQRRTVVTEIKASVPNNQRVIALDRGGAIVRAEDALAGGRRR
jgi:hypothetical protein